MRNLLLFAFMFLMGSVAQAEWAFKSGEVKAPVPYTYTIGEDDQSPNTDVLYVFHGGGGDETDTRAYAEALAVEWKKLGYAPPRVIGVSYGPIWGLVTQNSSPNSGLMEFTLEQVFPDLEKRLRVPAVNERHIVGHSMGGLNALHLLLHMPERFTRVAMLMPAILPLSPFATTEEMQAFADRHGLKVERTANDFSVREFLAMMKEVIPTPEDWEKWNWSARLGDACERALKAGSVPRLLVMSGEQDLPFREGAKTLVRAARKAGFSTKHSHLPGDHGDWDLVAIAKFLRR